MRFRLFCLLLLILIALITLLFSKNNIIKRSSKEIHELKNYKKSCEKGVLLSKNKFKRIQNPKISIISAVYNRGKYIKRFLRSIQNQLFNEIEIIFIDDFSTDNSVQIIEKFQKEDERIKLIKHNKNKGTLISRNDGILKSKGEYLIFPDPDDILSNDILKYCYNESHRNNYDIIKNFKKNIERNLKDCYLYLKFIFEYTKNNYFEKNIASLIYKNVHLEISNISLFQKITKDFDFYYNVINLYTKKIN